MKNTTVNHSIVEFEGQYGVVLNHNRQHSTVYAFNTDNKIVVPNSKIISKFHFDYIIFENTNDKEFSLFAKDFYEQFKNIISDFNHTFNLHDKVSEEEIIEDIDVVSRRMATLDKNSSLYNCYSLFKKHISNTLFLARKITESEQEYDSFSAEELKNILKHIN